MNFGLLLMMAACADVQEKPTTIPPALAAARERRAKIRFAKVEYSFTVANDPTGNPPHAHFYSWKCADDRVVKVDLGDEEKVVVRNGSGKPAEYSYVGPVSYLSENGRVWRHVQDSPNAAVFGDEEAEGWAVNDLREAGFNGALIGPSLEAQVRSMHASPLQYSQSREGELDLVVAESDGTRIKWWIDRDRGNNIVRSAVLQGDQLITETRFQLSNYEGIWFPSRMELFANSKGEAERRMLIEIISAEFNSPELPQALDVKDIGIEVGTRVDYHYLPKQPGVPRSLYWDGEKGVQFPEFAERVNKGELRPGSNLALEQSRWRAKDERNALIAATGGSPTPASKATKPPETEWQRYTRLFIERFGLDNEQTQKAWLICHNCEEDADKYRRRHEVELRRLEGFSKGARATANEAGEGEEVRAQLAKLLEPVNRIFEEQLKPRLESLPTRAQRAAAEKTPASAPTK